MNTETVLGFGFEIVQHRRRRILRSDDRKTVIRIHLRPVEDEEPAFVVAEIVPLDR